jgi:hypothetical protein
MPTLLKLGTPSSRLRWSCAGQIKNATEQVALQETGEKLMYLHSSAVCKEDLARGIAERTGSRRDWCASRPPWGRA